ncbi:MAG: helix-turn-helix domain-containing protein, partial [bacterium]|nr:helix-turn-helix domain-containing protein [bacterium]
MSAPSDKNILLSSTEAAEIAGVTSGYITRVCREGKLKGVRRDASWFVERAELEIYLVKVAAEKKVRAEKLAQERAAEYYANVPKKSSRRSPTLSRTMAVSFATLFLVVGAVWAEGTLVTPPVQKQTTVASALASAPSLELNVLGAYDTLKEWFLHPVYRFVQRVVPTRTPGIAEAIATPTLETKTIIERITERVIERTPVHMTRYVTESVTINGITEAILNERLLATRNETTDSILKKINDRNYRTADSSTSSGNLDGSTITNATFSGTSVTTNTLTATNATTTNLYTTGFGIGLDYLTDITGYGLDIQNGQLVVTLAASPFATSTADSWFTSKDTDDL